VFFIHFRPFSPIFHQFSSNFHPFSSIFIHFHPFSSIFIHFHPFFIHFHPFSSIFIHFHPFSSIFRLFPSIFAIFHPFFAYFPYKILTKPSIQLRFPPDLLARCRFLLARALSVGHWPAHLLPQLRFETRIRRWGCVENWRMRVRRIQNFFAVLGVVFFLDLVDGLVFYGLFCGFLEL
jgi:hypothetical protein